MTRSGKTMALRAFGWLMVHRPFMLLLVVLGALVGYLLVTVDRGIPVDLGELSMGLLSVLLVCAGVDVLHEGLDWKVDAINKPYRPVPRGLVSPAACYVVATMECLIGTVLGFLQSVGFGLFLVFIIALTTHYSLKGKGQMIVGQMESTIGSAMVPYAGAVIHGDYLTILPLCIFIWLFETGRWIMVNLEDYEADKERGWTLVHALGPRVSAGLAIGFYLVALFWTYWPPFKGDYSQVFVIGSSLFAFTLVWCWMMSWYRDHSEASLHLWHRNVARIGIVAYQVVLVTEVWV